MTHPLRVLPPRPTRSPMRELFELEHQHLMDAIQAGRSVDAYGFTRLLAFLGGRL